MTLIIRHEQRKDFAAVYSLHADCFPSPAEAKLVAALRLAATPIISLVAEVQDTIIGHIMFSPMTSENSTGLLMGLAPIAVAPKHQHAGVGSALIKTGLLECQHLKASYVVVLGEPDYYSRFGFAPAVSMGITSEYEVPAENFMALKTGSEEHPLAPGLVRYHHAFADL